MATKLIIALACVTLCNANPVLLKNYLYRNGRGYSVGQGYTNNPGGRATGSATSNGGVLRAYGSAFTDEQNPLLRNVFGVPYLGDAVAKAEVYDASDAPARGEANAVAEVQHTPTYYAVPAPATIVSYQQNFETPKEIRYEYPATLPQSSGSFVTSAKAEGTGSAESVAKTQGIGSYGITSSNAKTFGSGYGTASSNVNNGYGAANTAARTQGFGSASSKSDGDLGMTSAASQTNGGYASSSANNALNSAVVSANSQGTASSKADISASQGMIVSPVDFKGWRFGTAYTVLNPGQAQVSSQANGGSAKSTSRTDGVVTTADTQGYGSANANANLPGGHANSVANSNSIGTTKFVTGNGYGTAQSSINNGLGNIKSSANSNGNGNANSNAIIDEQGSLSSVSNSNGYGTAASSANSAPSFAKLRTDGLPYIYSPRTRVSTQTSGQGSASAKTQGLNTGHRVVNSAASSFGFGKAEANASA